MGSRGRLYKPKDKRHDYGPRQYTTKDIEHLLAQGTDPMTILIDMWTQAYQVAAKGWRVNRVLLYEPIIRKNRSTDPVCTQYEDCSLCPLDGIICAKMVELRRRTHDVPELYLTILKMLKEVNKK